MIANGGWPFAANTRQSQIFKCLSELGQGILQRGFPILSCESHSTSHETWKIFAVKSTFTKPQWTHHSRNYMHISGNVINVLQWTLLPNVNAFFLRMWFFSPRHFKVTLMPFVCILVSKWIDNPQLPKRSRLSLLLVISLQKLDNLRVLKWFSNSQHNVNYNPFQWHRIPCHAVQAPLGVNVIACHTTALLRLR